MRLPVSPVTSVSLCHCLAADVTAVMLLLLLSINIDLVFAAVSVDLT